MEMISVVPDIKDAPDAQPMQEVKGEISFENVSFHYADVYKRQVMDRMIPGRR